jgi:hypothetical protein
MDRISDADLSWLRGHISALKVSAYPETAKTYADVINVIDELRERREAEKQAEIDYYSNETHS